MNKTTTAALLLGMYAYGVNAAEKENLPNIIYILADDLGIGDLGCYGQRYIKTPAIDNLAKNGIVFTQHYAGCTVSAPSRCSLLTGKHTGHSFVRGNKGSKCSDGRVYDYPLQDEEVTLAEVVKTKGYRTACIGKWGLGGPGSEGHPNKQGFDYFFGYLGQGNAHRYYPEFLFENSDKINLNKKVYSHDLIMEKALDYIEKAGEEPFMLYLAPTIPHADLILPDGERGEYENKFLEKPFKGGGYTAQPKPKATFAAMVSRLDRDVKRVMDLLESKGIADNTIVIFSSDNGTHVEGGHDPYFFSSNGGFRGVKRDLYEGGVRTPLIVTWPKMIKEARVSNHVSAFWDFLPTVCDLIGADCPKGTDGISFLPTITEKGKQKKHDYLYWEFHEGGGKQAVLADNWKLIKLNADKKSGYRFELYNLNSDPTERQNVVKQYPEVKNRLMKMMDKAHLKNELYPFKYEK